MFYILFVFFVRLFCVHICKIGFTRGGNFVLTQELLILLVATIPSIFFSKGSWSVYGWRTQFVSVVVLITFYILVKKENNFLGQPRKAVYRQVLLLLYYLLLIRCMFILVMHFYSEETGYGFINGWHYVDFSVVVIFAFMLGQKLNCYFSALALAIAGCFLLEARMYKMYVILYYLFYYLFHGLIKTFKKFRFFKNFFRIIVWMMLLSVVLAFIWTFYVVGDSYPVNSYHTGLMDGSNYERFLTVINGLKSILVNMSVFFGNQIREVEKIRIFGKYIVDGRNGAHNSFIMLVQDFGIVFSMAYLYVTGSFFDRVSSRKNDALILSYLACCCILHNLLNSGRLFFLMTILILPWEESRKKESIACHCSIRKI